MRTQGSDTPAEVSRSAYLLDSGLGTSDVPPPELPPEQRAADIALQQRNAAVQKDAEASPTAEPPPRGMGGRT